MASSSSVISRSNRKSACTRRLPFVNGRRSSRPGYFYPGKVERAGWIELERNSGGSKSEKKAFTPASVRGPRRVSGPAPIGSIGVVHRIPSRPTTGALHYTRTRFRIQKFPSGRRAAGPEGDRSGRGRERRVMGGIRPKFHRDPGVLPAPRASLASKIRNWPSASSKLRLRLELPCPVPRAQSPIFFSWCLPKKKKKNSCGHRFSVIPTFTDVISPSNFARTRLF